MHLFLKVFVLSFFIIEVASGSSSEMPAKSIMFQTINIIILIALLYFLTKDKAIKYFSSRKEIYLERKESAMKIFREAQARKQEAEKKVEEVEKTRADVLSKAKKSAQIFKEKRKAEIEQKAERVLKDAKDLVFFEKESAVREIKREAIAMATSYAEKEMKQSLRTEGQQRLQKQFLKGIGAPSENAR